MRSLLLLAVAVLAFSPAMPARAANFFTWSADDLNYTLEGSSETCVGGALNGSASFDTTFKAEGTGSVKMELVGDSQNHLGCETASSSAIDMDDGTWRYYRWWMAIESGFDWGNTGKLKIGRIKQEDESTPSIWTLYISGDNSGGGSFYVGECHGCCSGADGCSAGPTDPSDALVSYDFPEDQVFHEYIMGVKLQTDPDNADGEFHVWVDGSKIGSVTGMRFYNSGTTPADGAEAWGGAMARPFQQICSTGNPCSSVGGSVWVDDFSVDDQFNSNFSGAFCGNGTQETGEDCDGSDLNSQTCAGLGYSGGSLACAGDCSFDVTGCTMGSGGPVTVTGVVRADGVRWNE